MQIRISKAVVLLLMFISGSAFAQNMTLKGVVIDAETNKPVEFANLGVVGSFMGTATDFNGLFELTISEEYKNYTVRISAVGYLPKELKAYELMSLQGVKVKMIQQSYGIDQVEVKAESKRLYGIIKTAANMISDNYEEAYSSRVYFSQLVNENQKTEMALKYFDEKGYGDRSFSNAYENRGYEVQEVRRNFEQKPIVKGMLRTDDLLEFDIVRVRGNVLDISVVDKFDLELVEQENQNTDSIWVIKYTLNKPAFDATGDEQVIDYKGVIYISSKDYAVIRNELEVKSKGYHYAGRSSGLVSENQNYEYKVVTSYRKTSNNKYALSKIEYSGTGSEKLKMDWVSYDYTSGSKQGVDRTYYSTSQTNEDFWMRFEIPKK
nr:carboxypeptidase-like regulatory domain-containing protein [uncultured Carboxylicivirga sp.]